MADLAPELRDDLDSISDLLEIMENTDDPAVLYHAMNLLAVKADRWRDRLESERNR